MPFGAKLEKLLIDGEDKTEIIKEMELGAVIAASFFLGKKGPFSMLG
jgi:hypothetical protein